MSLTKVAQTIGLYKGTLDLVTKLGIVVVAFFAPIQGLLLALFILVFIDLLTGVAGAVKQKKKITSAKLSRTITKLLVYLFTIILVNGINQYVVLSEHIPLTSMVASFIILTELQSILENVNKIAKQNVLSALIDKISLVTKGKDTTITRRKKK